MAKKPPPPPAPKKKSEPMAGMLLDTVAWGMRELTLPIPDFLFRKKKKKK